jgi:hypothetical protein
MKMRLDLECLAEVTKMKGAIFIIGILALAVLVGCAKTVPTPTPQTPTPPVADSAGAVLQVEDIDSTPPSDIGTLDDIPVSDDLPQ